MVRETNTRAEGGKTLPWAALWLRGEEKNHVVVMSNVYDYYGCCVVVSLLLLAFVTGCSTHRDT